MNPFRITFDDGSVIETSFNGTLADARAYYFAHEFNVVRYADDEDNLVRAVTVEELPPCTK